jgi:hypothetical protein
MAAVTVSPSCLASSLHRHERQLEMNLRTQILSCCTALGMFLTLSVSLRAQHARPAVTPRTVAYNPVRETLLQGTVLAFVENSSVPPFGAHVTLETASGTVDVQLGPATYLRAKHFSLAPGDSVRFVGAISRYHEGVVFLARIAQKGNQAITIRSTQGFLLAAGAMRRAACPKCSTSEPSR